MPNQILDRGQTANIGSNVIHGDLNVIGVGAHYTIAIGAAPATAHVIAPGHVDVYAINNQSVSVVNTTGPGGPPNMRISW